MLASAAVPPRVDVVVGFLSWWDGVELWLSGLGFVLQTATVMPVVLLLAYGVAATLDTVLAIGSRVFQRVRHGHDGGLR